MTNSFSVGKVIYFIIIGLINEMLNKIVQWNSGWWYTPKIPSSTQETEAEADESKANLSYKGRPCFKKDQTI